MMLRVNVCAGRVVRVILDWWRKRMWGQGDWPFAGVCRVWCKIGRRRRRMFIRGASVCAESPNHHPRCLGVRCRKKMQSLSGSKEGGFGIYASHGSHYSSLLLDLELDGMGTIARLFGFRLSVG